MIRKPWPSMLRTIWGDNERYLETYWEKFQNRYYVAGDSAHRDADGYFWIMGRIDDVLNVSGHRLGTMEVESALVAHPRVAEAAVVGRPHDIKGEADLCLRGVARRAADRRGDAGADRERCATGSASSWAPSPSPMTSALPTTCRRPVPARSCAGCCAPSPAARRLRRMSRRWRTRRSSSSCAAAPDPKKTGPGAAPGPVVSWCSGLAFGRDNHHVDTPVGSAACRGFIVGNRPGLAVTHRANA